MAEQRPKTKLLVVDDDAAILSQLRWALADEFDLLAASSADEARSLLREGACPEAALIDLHLPPDTSSIDAGLSVIRSLREASSEVRIVAFTAEPGPEAQALSRAAGATAVLAKPVERGLLVRLLQPTRRGGAR